MGQLKGLFSWNIANIKFEWLGRVSGTPCSVYDCDPMENHHRNMAPLIRNKDKTVKVIGMKKVIAAAVEMIKKTLFYNDYVVNMI